MNNLSESAAPVNRLIATINMFMALAGLPKLPDLPNLGSDAQQALSALDGVVNTLKQVRSTIPA
jgi:hypothetical protein